MMQQKRKSLRLFTVAQFIIVGMFGIVTVMSLNRLADVKDVLQTTVEDSVPQITRYASLNNQIQSLATRTTILSAAENEPARRLARREVNKVLMRLENTLSSMQSETFFSKQMSIIKMELEDLDFLVKQKISLNTDLNDEIFRFTKAIDNILKAVEPSLESRVLKQELLSLSLDVAKLDQEKRLQNLRQSEESFKEKEDLIFQNHKKLIEQTSLGNQFNSLFLGLNKLVLLKVETLLIDGRTRGRDSFMRNLIGDLAKTLEYQTELANREILKASNSSTQKAIQQTRLSIFISIAAVLVTIGIIYYLHRRIVVRLLSLSRQVDLAASKQIDRIEMDGYDEIKNLARTFSVYLQRVKEQEKELLNLSMSDPLTGIPNRRAFEMKLSEAISQARRNSYSLSIFLIDVDFFKPFNDRYGHTDGDACLRLVANRLNEIVVRNTDFCARYGGEEFVCILPNTEAEGAKQKSEELREAVERLQISHEKSEISSYVTISVGVATFPFAQDSTWGSNIIVEQADKALYKAKRDGRNCCRYFTVT